MARGHLWALEAISWMHGWGKINSEFIYHMNCRGKYKNERLFYIVHCIRACKGASNIEGYTIISCEKLFLSCVKCVICIKNNWSGQQFWHLCKVEIHKQ